MRTDTEITEELLRRTDYDEETWYVINDPGGGTTSTANALFAARMALRLNADRVLLYYFKFPSEPYATVELKKGE